MTSDGRFGPVLAELDAIEARLAAAVPSRGSMEEVWAQVSAARLPEGWQSVVERYADLLDDPVHGGEALKRAVFLVWYAWNEPGWLTGMDSLPPELDARVLAALDRELLRAVPDVELRTMLHGFGPGLPFELHPELAAVTRFFSADDGVNRPDVFLGRMEGRGAMGRYWRSRNDARIDPTHEAPVDPTHAALVARLRPFRVVTYSRMYADDLVRMWRTSFEQALGLIDPHSHWEQRAYFKMHVLLHNRVLVVLEDAGVVGAARVVAFVAASDTRIAQLYVAVDRQRRGIGEALLDWAKARSGGALRLHTFERNADARAFYERHGFRVVGRGFEAEWQLPDVEYEWVRGASRAT